MLLPSTGLTCGTFCSKEGVLISGTRMTVPEISAGSRRPINSSIAMMDAYSVPCAPATSARTSPGFAPWTTTTGMSSAASEPAGTASTPVAFWPGLAEAVPTANDAGSAAAAAGRPVIPPTSTATASVDASGSLRHLLLRRPARPVGAESDLRVRAVVGRDGDEEPLPVVRHVHRTARRNLVAEQNPGRRHAQRVALDLEVDSIELPV